MKRDFNVYLLIVYFSLKLKSTRNFPLHNLLQSKNRNIGKMRTTSFSQTIYLFACKSKIKNRNPQTFWEKKAIFSFAWMRPYILS